MTGGTVNRFPAAAAATTGVSLGLVQGVLGVAMPLVMYLFKATADGKQLKGDLEQFRLKVPMFGQSRAMNRAGGLFDPAGDLSRKPALRAPETHRARTLNQAAENF